MATILELRAMAGRASAPRSATGSAIGTASAEILFFPGVRYERWTDGPSAEPAKTRRHRDKLELED